MRRLRSPYTLLSGERSPSRREAAASCSNEGERPFQQFSWPQILSTDPTPASSEVPDMFYFNYSNAPDEAQTSRMHKLQNVMEHQHNLPKYDFRNNQDDILRSESIPVDISSADSESSYGAAGQFDEVVPPDSPQPYPVVTNYGSVSLLLRHLVRVDLSPEGAVYVQDLSGQYIVVVNSMGDESCILHSNGHVFQDGQDVHVMTLTNRIAKICQRGVVFSSSSRSLAYLVDESGTKSTADRFLDLRGDFSFQVFYDQQAVFDSILVERCYEMVSKSIHKPYQNGDDVWIIGSTQIKQDRYGNIEVSRDFRRCVITVLPTIGEVSLNTPFVSATVGCYSKRFLTVQVDNRRITAGFCGLTAQNGSQKAGLDRNGKVVIF